MRQPASVYVRFGRRTIASLGTRVAGRLRRILKGEPAGVPGARGRRPTVTEQALRDALTVLGVTSGDTLFVHSGISSLGKILGGPAAVFKNLSDMVGTDGHVLYPVFPFGGLMYAYLRGSPGFDALTSPTKMGALSEYALRAPGGLRSTHPTHSVIAFGPDSREFVAGHPLCPTPFCDGSPFARLAESGGKILLLGVGLNSVTSFHRTEDRLGSAYPVRVYRDEVFRIKCVDAYGQSHQVSTPAHDPFVSRIRDCDLVRQEFRDAGILRETPLGEGMAGIIDAAAMDHLLEELCQRRRTIYGKLWG